MGLTTLAGTQIQYFSFSEEVQAITTKFIGFIMGIAPGWIIFLTLISVAFIIIGVLYRVKIEVKKLNE